MATRLSIVYLWALCFIGNNFGRTLGQHLPLLLTTWNYTDAVKEGWEVLTAESSSPVDAVETVGSYCELHRCRLKVGHGGSPDERGETTLDAMIMDGSSHNVGAVGGLRRINQAIAVARKVLDNTDHSLLVGDQGGRVGDSPLPGAGSYADNGIGAAMCTGNGDIMMRFLPSYQAVTLMGSGMTPEAAAERAVNTILEKYPDFAGAVVAANNFGQYGASCHKWTHFKITVRNEAYDGVKVTNITCDNYKATNGAQYSNVPLSFLIFILTCSHCIVMCFFN